MKTVKKKRSEWQNLLRSLRNNEGYRRVLNIREIHRKRIIRENIEMDYRANKKGYDRMFREDIRRERVKPIRVQRGPNFYDLPRDPW